MVLAAVASLRVALTAVTYIAHAQAVARRKDRRLAVAVNNMSQGLVMFDAAGRMVVCNDRYIEIDNLSPKVMKPGITLREIIAHRIATGSLDRDAEEYRAQLLGAMVCGETISWVVEGQDGRCIAVVNKPMPGGDWLGTHEDITGRRRAQRELESTKSFFDSVIDNVPVMITVKGISDFRYKLVNRAGEDYFGLRREQLLGKTVADVFPREDAEIIAERDRETLSAGHDTFYDVCPITMPGRGTVRFFEPEMDARLRYQRTFQHDLRSAIDRDEIKLYYQPQMGINGAAIGFEALLRWHHPGRGIIPPSIFIPMAEESGLIVALGEWVLREACREAASWPRPLQIAVNLSPVQFKHGDLVRLVHEALLETGLRPDRLELEINEGVLIADFSRAVSILRRLKALGVRVAMDDFGTGYSSLSYLQSFPFDKIKIDRSFISNLDRNPQSAAIIRAVIGLGHGLALRITAEGVEAQAQLEFLERESCDAVQGYLFGRPAPIAEFAELVGRQAPARPRAAGSAATA